MNSTIVDAITIGTGPVKVMALHASGTGAESLTRLANALGTSVQVVIPNLHGYGESISGNDSDDSPLEQHYQIALAALRQFDGEEVHLVGHSMGAVVALMLVSRAESKVASLHLAEPVAFGVLDRKLDEDVIEEDRGSVEGLLKGAEDGIPKFIEYWNGTPWVDMPQGIKLSLQAMSRQIASEALCVSADRTSVDCYDQIGCPVQLLIGDRTNKVASRICSRLSDHHPDWKLLQVKEAGHMLPIEQPVRVADLVSPLLN